MKDTDFNTAMEKESIKDFLDTEAATLTIEDLDSLWIADTDDEAGWVDPDSGEAV